jgi:hypothetical protein
MSENEANFILYKAKNVDDALVSASLPDGSQGFLTKYKMKFSIRSHLMVW